MFVLFSRRASYDLQSSGGKTEAQRVPVTCPTSRGWCVAELELSTRLPGGSAGPPPSPGHPTALTPGPCSLPTSPDQAHHLEFSLQLEAREPVRTCRNPVPSTGKRKACRERDFSLVRLVVSARLDSAACPFPSLQESPEDVSSFLYGSWLPCIPTWQT